MLVDFSRPFFILPTFYFIPIIYIGRLILGEDSFNDQFDDDTDNDAFDNLKILSLQRLVRMIIMKMKKNWFLSKTEISIPKINQTR